MNLGPCSLQISELNTEGVWSVNRSGTNNSKVSRADMQLPAFLNYKDKCFPALPTISEAGSLPVMGFVTASSHQ